MLTLASIDFPPCFIRKHKGRMLQSCRSSTKYVLLLQPELKVISSIEITDNLDCEQPLAFLFLVSRERARAASGRAGSRLRGSSLAPRARS